MAPPLRLDYAVNDADVIAAFKRQQAEMEKERKARGELEKAINSNAAAQKTADKAALDSAKKLQAEQAKLAADASKISEAVRTPLQTYKAGLSSLIDHYKSGRITQDEYRASVDKLKVGYDDATGKTARMQEVQHRSNEETKEAKRVVDALKTPQQHFADRLTRLKTLHDNGKLSTQQYTAAMDAEKKKLAEVDAVTNSTAGTTGKFNAALGFMAVAGSVGFLKKMADVLRELNVEMTSGVEGFDKLSRKLGIQGGLSDAERKEQSRIVGKVAFDAAVPIDKAFETATQLSSSGFKDPIKGGALNTALGLMQSSNQIDGDAAGFIKGSGQFMTAFGMEKNETNLKDLGVRMQGLFKSTDVQAGDLPEFAKAAPILSGAKINLEESLSLLTALRETMNAGEAATGARNVVSLLQTSGAKEESRKALASVGLDSKQVDIEGEGVKVALDTLRDATSKLGEADRANVLTKIFGRENVASASILMQSTEKLDGFGTMQRNAAQGFQKDVKTARTGAFANDVRDKVSDQMESVKHEDFVTGQELLRDARINLRDAEAKKRAASGTFMGRVDAAVLRGVGAIEDNVVRPVIGERDLGLGHAQEVKRLREGSPVQFPARLQQQENLQQRELQQNRLWPQPVPQQQQDPRWPQNPPRQQREPQQNADRPDPQMEKQNALLEQLVQQGENKSHAGLVSGRKNNQNEGGL